MRVLPLVSMALLVLVGVVNLLPVLGVVSTGRLQALYGVEIGEANLAVLVRHRAVLFAVVGGLLVAAAFQAPLRSAAYAAGFLSMLSFVAIAWLTGGTNAELRRVVTVDGVASLALLVAWVLERVGSDAGP